MTKRTDQNNKEADNDEQVAHETSATQPAAKFPPMIYKGKSYKMPSKKTDLQSQLRSMIRLAEEARVKNATLLKQNSQYRLEISELQKAAMKMKKNKAVEELIKTRSRTDLFRKAKFIQDELEEKSASMIVYKSIYPAKEQKKLGKDHATIWCNTCGATVTSALNSRRSYIQGRMRDATMKFAKKHGYLPTDSDVLRCAMRIIDIKDPKNFQIMKWYWTEVMRKCFHVVLIIVDFVWQTGFHSLSVCLFLSSVCLFLLSTFQVLLWEKSTGMPKIGTQSHCRRQPCPTWRASPSFRPARRPLR